MGYKIIIITNQSGIARGYFSEDDFLKINGWMFDMFSEKGISITQTYYCPFHPIKGIGKYKKNSKFRKPMPGMIFKAQNEHRLDLDSSVLIGDKITDIQAGQAAGVKCNLLFSQKEPYDSRNVLAIRRLADAHKYLSQ